MRRKRDPERKEVAGTHGETVGAASGEKRSAPSVPSRRSFFQSLAAAPLALIGVKFSPRLFQLPVGCELSMTSLQWAINEGTRLRFGKPHTLVIGPENLFPARELLSPYAEDLFKREEFLTYEVTREFPYNCWRVEFEHGIVESQGP